MFSASHETEACGWSMDRAAPAAQTQRVRYTSTSIIMCSCVVRCKYKVVQLQVFRKSEINFLLRLTSFAVKESSLSPWLCVVVAPLFLRAASVRFYQESAPIPLAAPALAPLVPLASLRCAERGFLQIYLLWFTP